jgi:hypothetical protein
VISTLDLVRSPDEAGEEPSAHGGDGPDDGKENRQVEVDRDGPDVATGDGQSQTAEDEQRLHMAANYRHSPVCQQGFMPFGIVGSAGTIQLNRSV